MLFDIIIVIWPTPLILILLLFFHLYFSSCLSFFGGYCSYYSSVRSTSVLWYWLVVFHSSYVVISINLFLTLSQLKFGVVIYQTIPVVEDIESFCQCSTITDRHIVCRTLCSFNTTTPSTECTVDFNYLPEIGTGARIVA